jgi:signal transduction histidine kinase
VRRSRLALKQILDNALKYSPPGTPIEIRIASGDGGVKVAVTDHGPGIPAYERERIFDRFYRGPATKDRIPGSGLGLSIANSVAQAHDGLLTVASRPGETTFALQVPAGEEGAS